MEPQFHRNYWTIRIGIAVALALLFFAGPALAHSGRTDSQGGHYDSETGEYHFHHGYPAHQHYDIDGDGKPDCPYEFDDKTGSRSGSSSGSSAKAAKESGAKVTTTQAAAEEKESDGTRSAIAGWCTAGVATLAAFVFLHKIGAAEQRGQKLQQELQAEIQALKQENTAKQAEVDQAKRELDRQQGRIPRDIAFAPDGMPVYWRPGQGKPYGSYTVYIRRDSGIYHLDPYCAGWAPEVGHLFDVLETPLRPCKRCAAGRLPVEKIPDWYTECWKK